MKPLWFCIVSCHILWFTFTKAMINVFSRADFQHQPGFQGELHQLFAGLPDSSTQQQQQQQQQQNWPN